MIAVNPYKICVADNIVNGKQMAICWHIDDLQVSNMEELAVSALALKIAILYLYGPKTTISRGRMYEYLGTKMEFGAEPGTMIKSMITYLQKRIQDFLEVLSGAKTSPMKNSLFEIREEVARKLPTKKQARQIHHTMTQLLFLFMRVYKSGIFLDN